MPRKLLRVLAGAALAAAAVTVPVAPAHAGEAGRNCRTYYAQGNPDSGWGFTVCVKLEHDTVRHAWRTNASISTRTRGMGTMDMLIYFRNGTANRASARARTEGDFATAQTPWYPCSGRWGWSGVAYASAEWPNGVRSSITTTFTKPKVIEGSC